MTNRFTKIRIKRYPAFLLLISLLSNTASRADGLQLPVIQNIKLKPLHEEIIEEKNSTITQSYITENSLALSNNEIVNPKKSYKVSEDIIIFSNESSSKRQEFINAAKTGVIGTVKRLIAEGIDVDTQYTPANNCMAPNALIAAAQNGQTEIVRLLINSGANVDAMANCPLIDFYDNYTALIAAAQKGNSIIVGLLINANADIRLATSSSSSYRRNFIIDCLYKLIDEPDFDFNFDRPLFNDQTLLMIASAQGRNDIVDKLLEKKVDLNLQDLNGYTALMVAAQKGHIHILKKFIRAGAQINTTNDHGETAVSLAFHNDHINCLEELIINGGHVSINNIYELKRFKNMKAHMNLGIRIHLDQELINNLPLSLELGEAIIQGNIEAVKELITSSIGYWGNCTPGKECALALAIITEQTEIFTYLCNAWNVSPNLSSAETTLRAILNWICFLEPTNFGSYLIHNMKNLNIYEQ